MERIVHTANEIMKQIHTHMENDLPEDILQEKIKYMTAKIDAGNKFMQPKLDLLKSQTVTSTRPSKRIKRGGR